MIKRMVFYQKSLKRGISHFSIAFKPRQCFIGFMPDVVNYYGTNMRIYHLYIFLFMLRIEFSFTW